MKKLTTHLPQEVGSPLLRPSSSRLQGGATLVTALFAVFALSLFVGATSIFVTSTHTLAWSRDNSEAALLLAEGGVNRELQYITQRIQQMKQPYAHPYKTLSGEPYPGQPGSIDGMPGKVWVYATEPGSTKNWGGKGAVQITCTAEVGGAVYSQNGESWGPRVVRTLTVQCKPKSVFGAFALFGLDASNSNQQPSVGLTGNAVVRVTGNVGTNSRLQGGDGEIRFTRAYNYNTSDDFPGGSSQFSGSNVFAIRTPLVLPTVTEILRGIVPGNTPDPWAWIANNNDNDKIRQYNAKSGSLTYTGTTLAGFKREQNVLSNKSNAGALLTRSPLGPVLGSWTDINSKPGSSKKTLILPPGDYFLSELDIDWDSTIELVVDNAGLTTKAGNNLDSSPVRIWLNGTSQHDNVSLPITLTNPEDASTFKIFYNKDGSVFSFTRDPNFDGKDLVIAGCVYAVTNRLNPDTLQPMDPTLKGTQIDLEGDSSSPSKQAVLYGSLIADRVVFKGQCAVLYPSVPMEQDSDPSIGVGYADTCDREPCYGDR